MDSCNPSGCRNLSPSLIRQGEGEGFAGLFGVVGGGLFIVFGEGGGQGAVFEVAAGAVPLSFALWHPATINPAIASKTKAIFIPFLYAALPGNSN